VPAIFITHDQEEALELGDRIAVINSGRIEQIGTPEEVYNSPANQYVATFLGAANILPATIRGSRVEVGSALLSAQFEPDRFRDGEAVKIVFRPEDLVLSKTQVLPSGHVCFSSGLVEETSFVGAYERLRIKLDPSGSGACDPSDSTPYYLTTETPESPTAKPIIATRPKPETLSVKLRRGDRVYISLSAFTILKG
jgi:ABC-type Fe3+/spermidine/putrescine transport system ATPase subunit